MRSFHQYPERTRHMIVLGITLGVAFILVTLLVIIYGSKEVVGNTESGSKIKDFYNTILQNGQSYFGGK